MTITPLGAGAGVPTSGGPGAPAGDTGVFDALLQQHLPGDPDRSAPSEAAAILEAASAPSAVRSDALAALLAGLLAPGAGTADAGDGASAGAPAAAEARDGSAEGVAAGAGLTGDAAIVGGAGLPGVVADTADVSFPHGQAEATPAGSIPVGAAPRHVHRLRGRVRRGGRLRWRPGRTARPCGHTGRRCPGAAGG